MKFKINKMIKCLNLGCGRDYIKSNENENWVNLDINKEVKADVYHDLHKFPYPFKKNTFDKVYAFHILEHMKDTVRFMKEVWRICKPEARIIIRAPHFSVAWAWGNPTHYRAFSLETFYHFDKKSPEHYGDEADFKLIKKKLVWNAKYKIISSFIDSLANLNTKFCERFWCYYVGGFDEIYVELKIRK